jgi:hypothetical protein
MLSGVNSLCDSLLQCLMALMGSDWMRPRQRLAVRGFKGRIVDLIPPGHPPSGRGQVSGLRLEFYSVLPRSPTEAQHEWFAILGCEWTVFFLPINMARRNL